MPRSIPQMPPDQVTAAVLLHHMAAAWDNDLLSDQTDPVAEALPGILGEDLPGHAARCAVLRDRYGVSDPAFFEVTLPTCFASGYVLAKLAHAVAGPGPFPVPPVTAADIRSTGRALALDDQDVTLRTLTPVAPDVLREALTALATYHQETFMLEARSRYQARITPEDFSVVTAEVIAPAVRWGFVIGALDTAIAGTP